MPRTSRPRPVSHVGLPVAKETRSFVGVNPYSCLNHVVCWCLSQVGSPAFHISLCLQVSQLFCCFRSGSSLLWPHANARSHPQAVWGVAQCACSCPEVSPSALSRWNFACQIPIYFFLAGFYSQSVMFYCSKRSKKQGKLNARKSTPG